MTGSGKRSEKQSGGRPRAVFFDFDGTLAQGSASLELMNYLAEIKVFPEMQYHLVLQAVENHKSGKVSYDELCADVGKAWADGLRGREEAVVRFHAEHVFNTFIPKVYDSSFELVELFASNSYTTVIVSSGAHEINSFAADALGVKELHCTELEVVDGVYTGKFNADRGTSDRKAEVLTAMRNRFDLGKSFAFGDSASDEKVLSKIGEPVALNPTKELAELARSNNWKICTYENVVGEVSRMLDSHGRRPVRR